MKNFVENQEQAGALSYPDNEKDWEKKIKETTAEYGWGIFELLGGKESEKIEDELAFKDIPESEQAAYAETAGRLALGLMNYGGTRAFIAEEKSRFEMTKLLEKISRQHADLKPFLHMLCYHLAREANSNVYGNSDSTFSKIISDAAVNAAKAGKPEIHEGLVNPFHLQTGMEIFKFNKQAGEIEKFGIEVLVENGDGIVIFGPGENDYEDIISFNCRLSLGDYMTKDGENCLGGLKFLQNELGFDRLLPGMTLKTDIKTPMDKESKIEYIEIVKTNQAEVEEKYGKAYFNFLGKIPRNKKILTASFKSSSGKQFDDVNVMNLGITK